MGRVNANERRKHPFLRTLLTMRMQTMLSLLPVLALGLATAPIDVARSSIETPLVILDEADALRVAGADYKGRFDSAGVTFRPHLGALAPGNAVVRLRLEAARVGDLELQLDAGAEPHLEGSRVAYDRCGVLECYDLDPRGLCQSFLIEELPGRGALTLSVAFESEIVATYAGGAIDFLGVHGGVRYGEATAFDARGRSTPAPLSLREGAIDITIDEAFLADAELPLLVDPLVTTLSLDVSPFEDSHPDVAYDASLDMYVVVWQRRFSALDHDTLGQILSGDGALLRSFAIDLSTDDSLHPQVAGIEALDRFLVTTLEGVANTHTPTARLVDLVGGFTIGPPVQLSFLAHGLHDLGGDATTTPPYGFCAVAQGTSINGYHVRWQFIDADGTPGLWFETNPSDAADYGPGVAKSAHQAPGGGKRWAATWELADASVTVQMVYVELDAAEPWGLSHFSEVSTAFDHDRARARAVSSRLEAADGSGTHLVVWSHPTPAGPLEYRGRVMGSSGPVSGVLQLGPDPQADYPAIAVDADGSNFVVAFAEQGSGGNTLQLATYDEIGSLLNRTELMTLGVQDDSERRPAITSTRSGGGAPQRFFVAWDEVRPGTADLFGALYDTPGVGTPYCTGAANSVGPGARIHATGSKSLAVNDFRIVATGAVPNLAGVFYLGLAGVETPFGEGFRCIGGQVHRLLPVVTSDATGTASVTLDFTQPLGGLVTPGHPGVRYQYWYRDPAGGPSTFNLSDALHVEHLP